MDLLKMYSLLKMGIFQPVMLVCWSVIYLVVSPNLKHISPVGSFPQVRLKIHNAWNHHLVYCTLKKRVFFEPQTLLLSTKLGETLDPCRKPRVSPTHPIPTKKRRYKTHKNGDDSKMENTQMVMILWWLWQTHKKLKKNMIRFRCWSDNCRKNIKSIWSLPKHSNR